MNLQYEAAVLHQARSALAIEQVSATALAPADVLVRIRAAGLCHTDLEVIDGSLRYPMPIVLGHEAAGVIVEAGSAVEKVRIGDHVVLSWNPHCGHCFYCDRGLPILCEDYLAKGPQAVQFDGRSKARLAGGAELKHLMFLGAFGEYCIVQAQQAVPVPKDMPFDRACLIGCGVMTGRGRGAQYRRDRPSRHRHGDRLRRGRALRPCRGFASPAPPGSSPSTSTTASSRLRGRWAPAGA